MRVKQRKSTVLCYTTYIKWSAGLLPSKMDLVFISFSSYIDLACLYFPQEQNKEICFVHYRDVEYAPEKIRGQRASSKEHFWWPQHSLVVFDIWSINKLPSTTCVTPPAAAHIVWRLWFIIKTMLLAFWSLAFSERFLSTSKFLKKSFSYTNLSPK